MILRTEDVLSVENGFGRQNAVSNQGPFCYNAAEFRRSTVSLAEGYSIEPTTVIGG